jgi:flagellar basal body P-ring formation protein FlgA
VRVRPFIHSPRICARIGAVSMKGAKMDMTLWAAAAAMLAGATAAPAGSAGEDWQSLDARAGVIAAAMGKNAAPVDRRIKLPRCPETAVIEVVDAHALAARCLPLGWRLRIALTAPSGDGLGSPQAAGPVVRRGDLLRLRVESDGFELVYHVVAAAPGRTGDIIPVRADGNRTLLQAEVTGPGRAILRD